MNAVSQAITPELTSKIAHIAVLFRAEFPDSQIDLSPWLTDQKTQDQLDPYSIDLSFYLPPGNWLLACHCVFMQVHFSEALLLPTCQLSGILATGYKCTEPQWQFSTEDRVFAGLSVPVWESQEQFKRVVDGITKLFEHLTQADPPV